MILGSLTIGELISFDSTPEIDSEIARRLRTEEIFIKSQVEEIEDIAFRRASNECLPETVFSLCDLLDGEHWSEHLDRDTRDWLKMDLHSFIDTTQSEDC